MALTANGIKNPAMRPGYHHDSKGLYLRVLPSGGKSWAYRYGFGGKLREMSLGPLDWLTEDRSLAVGLNLEEARAAHAAARRILKVERRDPLAVRRAETTATLVATVKSMTFAECAERYIEAHRAGWRNAKHAAQWPQSLEAYVYPVFGELPVEAVDLGLVLRVIEPLWTTKTETASRVRGRIESVLDWATTRKYRTGENPARWKGHLENLLPRPDKVRSVEHLAAVDYVELPAFMARLREVESDAARALEFTILTGARTGEVVGARWSEIDLAERLWTIPTGRMKAGREHRVPLSAAAMAALPSVQGGSTGKVFQIAEHGMLRLVRTLAPGKTVHGFRSAFSDWCAERTNFPSEVREMALAHAVGSKVEAAYRRGDLFEKRRQLAEAWSQYCAGAVGGVVVLRPGAAG